MNVIKNIYKLGTLGMILVAILSPCCFPIFAFIASALGLGSFEMLGTNTMWFFSLMVLLSIIGFYLSYRTHKLIYPLLLSVICGLMILYGYYVSKSNHWMIFTNLGMGGILIATLINFKAIKMKNRNIVLLSTLTCPKCSYQKEETMPTNACMFFYECENCKTRLKPIEGDCCVFCSYGTIKCPPIQEGVSCC